MNDIFISYAHEDYETAERLAKGFGNFGWSVWWDRKILTGQSFDQAIERELESAKSVVVIWSKHSVESEWVRNEAAAAAERGVLEPASLGSVKLPLEFRHKQTADLSGWDGEASHHGFQSLCASVANLIGSELKQAPPRAEKKKVADTQNNSKRWVALTLLLFLLLLAVYWFGIRRATPTTEEATGGGLADLVAGAYQGDVIADAKGHGQSDVRVTVEKIGPRKVRVTSDYERLGTVEVPLTRAMDTNILNADGDTVFHVYLDANPHKLELSVHNEISYSGTALKK